MERRAGLTEAREGMSGYLERESHCGDQNNLLFHKLPGGCTTREGHLFALESIFARECFITFL